ncbi:MAG: cob(I)yrinic acid a,c-diamide adenosyltransferase [Desulfobacteraceae bacterium]|nr:cob(I)yrinic acid a,c-diamide adenosyltransferase [Desulfobacteraceae bacterium]
MRGFVHVYTGNGKGKTTAAIGLSIRAAGAGLKVFIAQFIKMGDYSEIKALKRYSDLITIKQFGHGRFVDGKPDPEDIAIARQGYQEVRKIINAGEYQVVILEEANVAVKYGLLAVQELINLIVHKPEHVEMIITGRYASPRVIEYADLVTEMRMVKHYYQKGVVARVGIEK